MYIYKYNICEKLIYNSQYSQPREQHVFSVWSKQIRIIKLIREKSLILNIMDDNVNCAICNKLIHPQIDETVKCNGSCFKRFHAKCLKLTTSFLKQVRECKNVFVNCDDCAVNPIMSLNETVKKMLSYLQIIDERIKRHDEEFKIVNEEINTMNEMNNNNTEGIKAEINKVAVKISGERRDYKTMMILIFLSSFSFRYNLADSKGLKKQQTT